MYGGPLSFNLTKLQSKLGIIYTIIETNSALNDNKGLLWVQFDKDMEQMVRTVYPEAGDIR